MLGLGDYESTPVIAGTENTLMGLKTGSQVLNGLPSFGNGHDSNILVRTECVADVYSSTDFQLTKYEINPGIYDSYPWGSGVANNYLQWRPLGELWRYVSLSSNALDSTNTALGLCAMTVEYDPSAPVMTSMRQVLNNVGTVSQKPSCTFDLPVECRMLDRAANVLYVRSQEASEAKKFQSDLGSVYVATEGMQAAGVLIGKLWHTYRIELLKPQEPEELGGGGLGAGASGEFGNASDAFPGTTGINGSAWKFNTLGITGGLNTLIFPASVGGVYCIQYGIDYVSGSTGKLFGGIGVTGSEGTDLDTYLDISDYGPGNALPGVTGSTVHSYTCSIFVAFDSAVPIPKELTFTVGTMSSIFETYILLIEQVPDDVLAMVS